MVAGAGLLLMLIFYRLIQVPYTMVAAASSGKKLAFHEQVAGIQSELDQMSGGYWLLTVLLILLYLALYGYGLYDAWRQAQSETEKDLGIL